MCRYYDTATIPAAAQWLHDGQPNRRFRMQRLALSVSFVLAAAAPAPAPVASAAPPAMPAQIIIFRHGEQPANPSDPNLSALGRERAARLVTFIMNDPEMGKFGTPVAIFATRTTKHGDGQRTQQTVAPLAAALKLPVQTPFLGKDYRAAAAAILSNGAYAGRTVVVCWNHEEIPQLVAALGAPQPSKWKGKVYDLVYVVRYLGGRATLTAYPERLAR
jgi:hypothetical protein